MSVSWSSKLEQYLLLHGPQVYLQPLSLSRVLSHLERSDMDSPSDQSAEQVIEPGSQVKLLDKSSGELLDLRIAVPGNRVKHDSGLSVSAFSPLGSELLGLKEGESAVVSVLGIRSKFFVSKIEAPA